MPLVNQNEARVKAFTVLIKSSQSVQKLIKQDFLKKEINLNEYAVLELLYHKGDQAIQSIGKKILMGSGSITYVIDKLEERGFLFRQPCPVDRRKMFACITDEGKAYMRTRVVEQEAVINKVFEELDDEEIDTAIDLFKRIGIHAESLLN